MTPGGVRRRLAAAIAGGALGLVLATPLSAQWHVGIQTGGTIGTLSGGFVERADIAYGATIGADVEYWFAERWVIDADLVLLQRGASNIPHDADVVDFRFNYLETPLMVGHAFPILGRRWAVSPYAGLSAGWISDCGVRFEGQSHYMKCEEGNPGGPVTKIDVNVPFGVAFRHRYPGGSRLTLDLRFAVSITPVLQPDGREARSRVLQLLFSFVLPLSEENR